jgi:hypothetical protein
MSVGVTKDYKLKVRKMIRQIVSFFEHEFFFGQLPWSSWAGSDRGSIEGGRDLKGRIKT